jgi:septal ring factor EnvC (AmiA/AmiB activator)
MNRTQKVTGFLFVALLGVYGCAKAPVADAGGKSSNDAKVQRLEDDLRTTAAARDAIRQKLSQAEERQTTLQRQLAAATVERDGLKTEVKARAAERDALQAHYDTFRKNIKELVGQAESSLGNPSAPPVLVGSAGN